MRYGAGSEPLAIAHRGGARLACENTLEAFTRSYALGVRYLETDVRVSADGRLVAFHDATLARLTPVRGRVRARTLAELAQLPVLGGGHVLPMATALAAFPDACFTIDVKQRAAVGPLARLLREFDATERVCVAGARGSWLSELRELAGAVQTALSWRELVLLTRSRRRPRFAGRTFAHVPLRLGGLRAYCPDVLHRADSAGIRVVVWTVDDRDTMHRLLDDGVHGIITDRPDVLREVLIERGQWRRPDYGPAPSVLHFP